MATTVTSLPANDWADLGPTPCFLQNTSDVPAAFVLETAKPNDPNRRGHVLAPGGLMAIALTLSGLRVYARTLAYAPTATRLAEVAASSVAASAASGGALDFSDPANSGLAPAL